MAVNMNAVSRRVSLSCFNHYTANQAEPMSEYFARWNAVECKQYR